MGAVRILSTGSFLPGAPVTNDDLERLVGPLPEDILEGIKVKQRHWMVDPDTGEHLINNSAMAVEATRNALEAAGCTPEDACARYVFQQNNCRRQPYQHLSGLKLW